QQKRLDENNSSLAFHHFGRATALVVTTEWSSRATLTQAESKRIGRCSEHDEFKELARLSLNKLQTTILMRSLCSSVKKLSRSSVSYNLLEE
ncbi:unnamed protein product, partial [Ceratitis capitata]